MLTLIINYDSIKYMEKIQTWLSDLSDWFYNIKRLNIFGITVNILQDLFLEVDDILDTQQEQIKELYKRVRVLEIAETNRQFQAIIAATDKAINTNKKSIKKSKAVKSNGVSKSKKAKEKKRQ